MAWLLGGYIWLFIHRPFEVWPSWGALHVERLYMVAMIVAWVFAARKSWTRTPLNAALALFAVALVASWWASPYREMGDATVQTWLQVGVFYVLLISTIHTQRDLKRVVFAYLFAVGLYMAHSLWEYRNGRFQFTMGTARMLGVDLTFGDPNTFAATLLYSLPLALALWPQTRRLWQRGALAGYAALSAVCILLTSSRSGFVGLCFLACMTAGLSAHRLRWLLLLAMLAPATWYSLPEHRQTRFLTLIDPSYGPAGAQQSAEGRAKGWHDGLEIWSRYPLTGVGPGAFKEASGSGFESHQLYGQVLGELGTLGAIAFVGLLGALGANAWAAYRLARRNPELCAELPYVVVRATSQSFLLLLLLGLAGHNLYRYTWLWFGAFQSIALRLLVERTAELDAGDEELEPLAPPSTEAVTV